MAENGRLYIKGNLMIYPIELKNFVQKFILEKKFNMRKRLPSFLNLDALTALWMKKALFDYRRDKL